MRHQNNTYRQSLPVPGPWYFQIDQDRLGEKEDWFHNRARIETWGTANVPGAWNAFEPALWTYEGIGWYAVKIPGHLRIQGRRTRLVIQRFGYAVKAWLDGEFLGEQYGGDLPFVLEVGDKLAEGNEPLLVLRVDNETRPGLPPGSQVIERLMYGGLLKPVLLELLPQVAIQEVKITAVPADGWARIRSAVEVQNSRSYAFEGSLVVTVPGGGAAQAAVRLDAGSRAQVDFELDAAELLPWSPDSPQLYTLTAQLLEKNEAVIDEVQERFGVRSIAVRGNQVLLNGKPVILRGVCRYDEFAGVGPVATQEAMLHDLQAIKACGANFVRTHYPQDPDLLDLMDEVGLMVMEEVFINWWAAPWLEETAQQESTASSLGAVGEQMLAEMIRRDTNHPCVIAWSMMNESGTHTPPGSQVVLKMLRLARRLDPGRLATFVVAGDPRPHPACAEADFVAFNCYPGVFGELIAFHQAEFAEKVSRPLRELLSAVAAHYPDKPLVITEFGCHAILGLRGDQRFSEDYQAAYVRAAWQALRSVPGVQGGAMWCWADYYHRRGFMGTGLNAEYGPFGVVSIDRRPKQALATLTELYHQ